MAYSLFETAELGPLISKNRTVRSATNEHRSEPSGQITPARSLRHIFQPGGLD